MLGHLRGSSRARFVWRTRPLTPLPSPPLPSPRWMEFSTFSTLLSKVNFNF